MIKKQTLSKQQSIYVGTQIVEFSWFKQHEIIYEQPTNQWKQLMFDNLEWFLILLLLIYCITFYILYKAFSKKATNMVVNVRKESLASDDMQNSLALSTEQNELPKKDSTSSTESSPRQNIYASNQDIVSDIKQSNKRKLTDISQDREEQLNLEKNETDNNFVHREKNKDLYQFEDYVIQQKFMKSNEKCKNLKTSNNIEQNSGRKQTHRIQQTNPDWSQYLENGKFEKLYASPTVLGNGAFGEVYKCQKIVDLKQYAVKRIFFKVQNEINLRDHPIFREINGLQEINHKNIVRYYTSWIQELSTEMIEEITKLHDLVTEKQQEMQNNVFIDQLQSQNTDEISHLNDCVQIVGDSGTENDKQIQTNSKNSKTKRNLIPSDFSSQIQALMRKFHFNPNQNDEQYQLFMLFIEMELCDFTLKDFIENIDRKKDQKLIKSIFKQIIEGVVYMHNQQFIHRDLKPQNIFINSKKEVKIGVLGLCNNQINQGEEQAFETNLEYINNSGTSIYMAPEVKGGQFGSAADIYALGIILFEMLWKFQTNSEKLKLIQNLTQDYKLPQQLFNDYPSEFELIINMVSEYPERRPTAMQIIESLNELN
ncbi:unnamed protein product (macronuclear) [Paramecium tetraurelia]|uniref:non-specific serine/threonine protein kinase n=1 Tax=Paramecium tetraurelia TaxID=5888 RepID=A0BPS8_PARTE|nr:uncharacterized protein GSPATT00005295001 [Paramecium tetraurelia]CAK60545.1 unnamed protein product [Paramecium tetraurelia]|eukprot:XP_001427943.1 hypothetical protein (macronuclear) [Paramecium tetraurelia strain d4-2]